MSFNKLYIKIILVLIIGLGFWYMAITMTYKNEGHTIGKYGYLLEDNLDYSKMLDYCYDNNLNVEHLIIYEAEYSVFNTGTDFGLNSLPIFNPNVINSILGAYSSIPIYEKLEGNADRYYLYADSEWYGKQPKGALTDKLIVRYLMSTENIDTIDESISIKQGDAVKTNKQNIETVKLAKSLRRNIPVEKQENLKQLVLTYVHWISNNISYPASNDIEKLRRTYVNLSSSDTTIKLGVGVCEDNMNVLGGMMKAQGVETYSAVGIVPTTLTNGKLLPNNFTGHGVSLITVDNIGYFVDPTLQDNTKNEKLKLPNGLIIMASKKNEQNNITNAFPMFPTSIKEIPMSKSAFYTKLEQVSVKKIGN